MWPTSTTRSLVLLGAVSMAAPASKTVGQIHWRSGAAEMARLDHGALTRAIVELAARPNERHVVVRFDRCPASSERVRLKRNGLSLLRYVGGGAYFASLASEGVNVGELSGTSFLAAIGPIERAWKLEPEITAGNVPAWAIGDAGEAGDPAAGIYVVFHGDVALEGPATQTVRRHGATVRARVESINALVVELPLSRITALADEDAVQWIEWPLPALSGVNDGIRAVTEADLVQGPPYGLDGSGVTVMLYDEGKAYAGHADFGGRLAVRDSSFQSDHSTHVAATLGGSGALDGGRYRGTAPGVIVESYGFDAAGGSLSGILYTNPGDLEDDYAEAIHSFGADISNNSLGSNVAGRQLPCDWMGNYGVTSVLIDTIVRGDSTNPLFDEPFRVIWANGNERGAARCGEAYYTTAPPACAKNLITVGAVNSNDESVTYFSSWGPTDDGRLTPHLVAPGCQIGGDNGITSASSSGIYRAACGTSMAAPAVSGVSAMLLEDFRRRSGGAPDFRNSTLKVLLAQSAEDIENVGPDYKSGYGSVRIGRAVDLLRSTNFVERQVDQGDQYSAVVLVSPADDELKVTLAWDDVAGAPNVVPALVNDLDLRVYGPLSGVYYPWTLDPGNPAAPAVRTQADHLNNIEQIVVDDPATGAWRVKVIGFAVAQGPQSFSLCASGQLAACGAKGALSLDAPSYRCDAMVAVRLLDCDLNADGSAIESVAVNVASDSSPAGRVVVLTETAAMTGDFRGGIQLDDAGKDGTLLVADGDVVTASYVDADDGERGQGVLVTATAGVDCQGPLIRDVRVGDVYLDTAAVGFGTDERATVTVYYGTACGSLSQAADLEAYGTEHRIDLTALQEDTEYLFAIEAVDEEGNVTTDDNDGLCHSFATLGVVHDFPMDKKPGWDAEGQWAFGVPTGGGGQHGGPDPAAGHTGVNVYGYNLAGDYAGSLPEHHLTTAALDCTGLRDVKLTFRRWLGVEEARYDHAYLRASNDGSNWVTLWQNTVEVADDSWRLQRFDISNLADGQATVYLRWTMGPADDGFSYAGWNVDDVQVIASTRRLALGFPNGLPDLLAPGVPTDVTVRIFEGDESYLPGSAMLHFSYDGGAFQESPLAPLGGDIFRATLPPADCAAVPRYYFSAGGSISGAVSQPRDAPAETFRTEVGERTRLLEDDFSLDQGWKVADSPDLTDGTWERAMPAGGGGRGDPPRDRSGGGWCYVTDNEDNDDIDGGLTWLTSPALDLSAGDAQVRYALWYSNNTGADPNNDFFVVWISIDDGTTWTEAQRFGPGYSAGWTDQSFLVGDLVPLTDRVKVRFEASDLFDPSIVEAAIDDFRVTTITCGEKGRCDDGRLNQGEERIDCGGPCQPCACLSDAECDDAEFCDGWEICDVFGACHSIGDPCGPAEWCDDGSAGCVAYGDGDFDGDGDVDLPDFAAFQLCFGRQAGGGCEPANLTGDEMIDLLDFLLLAELMAGPR